MQSSLSCRKMYIHFQSLSPLLYDIYDTLILPELYSLMHYCTALQLLQCGFVVNITIKLLGFCCCWDLCRFRCCVENKAAGFLLQWKEADANGKMMLWIGVCVLFGARTKSLLKVAQNAPFYANLCAHICENIATE